MKQLLTLILVLSSIHLTAQTKADAIIGTWLTGGKESAKINVYKQGKVYYGKIVWLKNPTANGVARLDSKNPDETKRNREIIGLVILNNFRFETDEWSGGKIYDPESGNTYSCNISLKDNNILKVRGYIGISLLGRTETWTRTSL
ncbi:MULTISPECIES: DUF2147 domain-containing protein [Niastella]|uniref:DUF2147 domain-containing protein n=1 Tax=Niastella soli TaxID=2821487 RepID=A0ABS3Z5K8_9BACT|nr:DUF2147 domain-containing protein [Niastella soli]MBO9205428.1 DUF2147 domain-containing protein [Niastella soli]